MGDFGKKEEMKVLFVITSVPFGKDYTTVVRLVDGLVRRGHEVSVFLSGNGVYYLTRPEASFFPDRGVRVLFCSHSAHQRGVEEQPPWAESSSTYNLSRLMGEMDRVVVFN